MSSIKRWWQIQTQRQIQRQLQKQRNKRSKENGNIKISFLNSSGRVLILKTNISPSPTVQAYDGPGLWPQQRLPRWSKTWWSSLYKEEKSGKTEKAGIGSGQRATSGGGERPAPGAWKAWRPGRGCGGSCCRARGRRRTGGTNSGCSSSQYLQQLVLLAHFPWKYSSNGQRATAAASWAGHKQCGGRCGGVKLEPLASPDEWNRAGQKYLHL